MNVIGLNDNNKLRSDYVYDTNQGKTQAEINSNQATVNANQATVNNQRIRFDTNYYTNAYLQRAIQQDSRILDFTFDVAQSNRVGILANISSIALVFNAGGIWLGGYNTSTNQWITFWNIYKAS